MSMTMNMTKSTRRGVLVAGLVAALGLALTARRLNLKWFFRKSL